MSLLIGSFGHASGPPSALAIILLVATAVLGLGLIVFGFRMASVARQRLGDELRARHAELSVQDGDPRVPPSDQGEPSGSAFSLTPVSRSQDGVQMLQTLTGPVRAILRARAGGNLEPVRPYLVASLYQRLNRQTTGPGDGKYRLYMDGGASVPEVQAMRVGLSTNGSDQRWTLVRSHNLILCRSCGGSVSGAVGDTCRACGTACTGFEAGWRVLDIAAA
jgi:hypothetical protein